MTEKKLLEVRGLTKYFDGIVALQNVSFAVNTGDVLGIVGPNGTGKTTLFNLIAGQLEPTSGELLYQGVSIVEKPPTWRVKAGIARTFQRTRLFYNLRVEENIRLGFYLQEPTGVKPFALGTSSEQSKLLIHRVEALLDKTGLERYRDYPAADLSYGYQRRLELAIALGTQPKLLLLDEPFGGQSPQSIKEMGRLIQALRDEGLTIMMIEHRMESIVSYCNRLFVMRDGRLVIPHHTQAEGGSSCSELRI
jgi:branched-chain amino acid transport system ATP-binding protein